MSSIGLTCELFKFTPHTAAVKKLEYASSLLVIASLFRFCLREGELPPCGGGVADP